MSTDLDHFGLWPSALGIATESAGQPTSMMAFDDYNMSPAVWDMPGAAFDAEFESLDHRSGDDAITHPLAPEMWNDFTNLPPGVDFPQLSDQPQLDLTSILDSMYDTNSNMGSLAMLESVPVPSRDLAPTNDEYMLGENIWTSTPAVGVRKGSGQLEPAISVDSAMTASGQASDERQNWPSRVAPFPVANATRSQRFITGRRKSEKGVNNTKQVFRPRLASPIQRSHSTASQNCNVGRSKRGMSTIQSIPSQNHIITAELLWQKDSKVSAKTSEGAFHIFSFADEPVQQRTRKPFSPDRLKEVNIVRSLKACNSCRRAKVACRGGLICQRCSDRCFGPLNQPCIRENLRALAVCQPRNDYISTPVWQCVKPDPSQPGLIQQDYFPQVWFRMLPQWSSGEVASPTMKGKGLVIPRDPANIKALFGAATCSRASWMKLFHVEGVTVKGVLAQCWLGLGNIQYDAFRAPSRLLTALLILGVVKYAKAKCLVHDGCSELVRKEETTWQATTGFLWGQISRCETILLSKLQQRLVERSGPCYSEKELWELRWLIQGLVIARQGIGAMVKTQGTTFRDFNAHAYRTVDYFAHRASSLELGHVASQHISFTTWFNSLPLLQKKFDEDEECSLKRLQTHYSNS